MDKYLVPPHLTVRETIERMMQANIKAVVVVDENSVVLGLFSNGDMRSFFLRGGELSANITTAMNRNPILYSNIEEIENENETVKRVLYPIVNQNHQIVQVVDYYHPDDEAYISDALQEVPLVIMAGGKGTRLYPYTKILPKPLLPLGDITITERIIRSFRNYGCKKVFMILNHKSNMIKAYMLEVEKDYELSFLEEANFFGTAGGIRLLKGKMDSAFFLSNCDILLNTDLECAYKTHKKDGNILTFICAMKDFIIPYGVIETEENGSVKKISEKPDYSYLVNTGVYIVEPEAINYIADGEHIDLPELAARLIDSNLKVGVFPIPEKAWMDIGQFSEMENTMKTLGINV